MVIMFGDHFIPINEGEVNVYNSSFKRDSVNGFYRFFTNDLIYNSKFARFALCSIMGIIDGDFSDIEGIANSSDFFLNTNSFGIFRNNERFIVDVSIMPNAKKFDDERNKTKDIIDGENDENNNDPDLEYNESVDMISSSAYIGYNVLVSNNTNENTVVFNREDLNLDDGCDMSIFSDIDENGKMKKYAFRVSDVMDGSIPGLRKLFKVNTTAVSILTDCINGKKVSMPPVIYSVSVNELNGEALLKVAEIDVNDKDFFNEVERTMKMSSFMIYMTSDDNYNSTIEYANSIKKIFDEKYSDTIGEKQTVLIIHHKYKNSLTEYGSSQNEGIVTEDDIRKLIEEP